MSIFKNLLSFDSCRVFSLNNNTWFIAANNVPSGMGLRSHVGKDFKRIVGTRRSTILRPAYV